MALSYGVMAAQQVLVLFVQVRVLVGQLSWIVLNYNIQNYFLNNARVVELVDTLVSGSSGFTAV